MKNYLLVTSVIFVAACAAHKAPRANTDAGHTRTQKVEFLDAKTFKLTVQSKDSSYGFEPHNGIKVGGYKSGNGPSNQRAYLNALLGPDGEEISYHRSGSCCGFETPNGFGGIGLMDRYKIYWEDSDTFTLYLNFYDEGDLMIPVGLQARTR